MEAGIDTIASFHHVSKSYRGASLVTDISFEFGSGELVALIGPQDAGKTTVMRLMLGLTEPDEGAIRLFGSFPADVQARRTIGAMLTRADLPENLKIGEVLDLVRAHYPEPAKVEDLVDRYGFAGQLDRSIGSLDVGDSRWLSVLLAFAGNPDAVFMDMPTSDMDVGWRRQFWLLVRQFTDDGGLALLTTNVLHEVEAFATRVLILHKGRIIADGTVDEIVSQHGRRTIEMRTDSLPDLDGIAEVEWHDGGPILHTSDADTIVRQLATRGVSFEDLEVRRPELEEGLLALIQEDE